jgi:hypothetical protein
MNLNTKSIIESRDVIWVSKIYTQHIGITHIDFTKLFAEDNDFVDDLFEPLQSIAEDGYHI